MRKSEPGVKETWDETVQSWYQMNEPVNEGETKKEKQEYEREGKRGRDTSIDFQCHLVVVSRGNTTVVGSSMETMPWQLSLEKRRTTLFFFSAGKTVFFAPPAPFRAAFLHL